MTAIIYFFSGTGNTWWCAERLSERLTTYGVACRISSIEPQTPEAVETEVATVDLVGLGWPVYGSDVPEPMKHFIDRVLPEGCGRSVFTFCTQLLFSGNGARVYERELAARGWTIGWSAHFLMPNNICVTAFPFRFSADPGTHTRRLERTGGKVDRFAGAIARGRRFAQGRSRASAALGALQLRPYRRWFPRLRDDISVDPERCVLCGRCVAICPSGNLSISEGRVLTHGTCVLCVRCYNFCPVQAVRYAGKLHRSERGLPYRGPVHGFRPEDLRS